MELSLRLGDVGVIQANTYEERADLVGAEGWRVRFMGGGVTWSSTQSILNQLWMICGKLMEDCRLDKWLKDG